MYNLNSVTDYESLFPLGAIIDGVINPKKYFKSKIRIGWFLKEAYSDETEGFHIKLYLGQENAYENFFRTVAIPTWHTIIYTSCGILKQYEEYDHIPWIRDKIDLCDIVDEIAIINVNKFPSATGTYTLFKNLNNAFPYFKNLILKQIDALEPQVFIFGNTFHLYKEFLNINDNHKLPQSKNNYRCDIYSKDNKIFIDTYHPANTKLTREKYCNQIINAVHNSIIETSF